MKPLLTPINIVICHIGISIFVYFLYINNNNAIMEKNPESTPFQIFRFRENSKKFVVEILTQNLAFNLSGAIFFIGLGCSLKWWYKDQLLNNLLKQNLPALSEPQKHIFWETGEYVIGEQTHQFVEKRKNVLSNICKSAQLVSPRAIKPSVFSSSICETGRLAERQEPYTKEKNKLVKRWKSTGSVDFLDVNSKNSAIPWRSTGDLLGSEILHSPSQTIGDAHSKNDSINAKELNQLDPQLSTFDGTSHKPLTPLLGYWGTGHAKLLGYKTLSPLVKSAEGSFETNNMVYSFNDLIKRLDLYSNHMVIKFKSPWQKHAYHRFVGVFPEFVPTLNTSLVSAGTCQLFSPEIIKPSADYDIASQCHKALSLSKNNPSLKHVKIATSSKRFSSKNQHAATQAKKRRDFLCNIALQCSFKSVSVSFNKGDKKEISLRTGSKASKEGDKKEVASSLSLTPQLRKPSASQALYPLPLRCTRVLGTGVLSSVRSFENLTALKCPISRNVSHDSSNISDVSKTVFNSQKNERDNKRIESKIKKRTETDQGNKTKNPTTYLPYYNNNSNRGYKVQLEKYTFWEPPVNWFQLSARGICILNGESLLKPTIRTFFGEPTIRSLKLPLSSGNVNYGMSVTREQRVFGFGSSSTNVLKSDSPLLNTRLGSLHLLLGDQLFGDEIQYNFFSYLNSSEIKVSEEHRKAKKCSIIGTLSHPLELTTTMTGWHPSVDTLLLNSYLDEIPYKLESTKQQIESILSPLVKETRIRTGCKASKEGDKKNTLLRTGSKASKEGDKLGVLGCYDIVDNVKLEKTCPPNWFQTNKTGVFLKKLQLVEIKQLLTDQLQILVNSLPFIFVDQSSELQSTLSPSLRADQGKGDVTTLTCRTSHGNVVTSGFEMNSQKQGHNFQFNTLGNNVTNSQEKETFKDNLQPYKTAKKLGQLEKLFVDFGTRPEKAPLFSDIGNMDPVNVKEQYFQKEKRFINTVEDSHNARLGNGLEYPSALQALTPQLRKPLPQGGTGLAKLLGYWGTGSEILQSSLPADQVAESFLGGTGLAKLTNITKSSISPSSVTRDGNRITNEVGENSWFQRSIEDLVISTHQAKHGNQKALDNSVDPLFLLNSLGITFNTLAFLKIPPVLLPIDTLQSNVYMWNQGKSTNKVHLENDYMTNHTNFRFDPDTLTWEILQLFTKKVSDTTSVTPVTSPSDVPNKDVPSSDVQQTKYPQLRTFFEFTETSSKPRRPLKGSVKSNKNEDRSCDSHLEKPVASINKIIIKQKKSILNCNNSINSLYNLIDNKIEFTNKKSRLMSGYIYPDKQSNSLKTDLYRWTHFVGPLKFLRYQQNLLLGNNNNLDTVTPNQMENFGFGSTLLSLALRNDVNNATDHERFNNFTRGDKNLTSFVSPEVTKPEVTTLHSNVTNTFLSPPVIHDTVNKQKNNLGIDEKETVKKQYDPYVNFPSNSMPIQKRTPWIDIESNEERNNISGTYAKPFGEKNNDNVDASLVKEAQTLHSDPAASQAQYPAASQAQYPVPFRGKGLAKLRGKGLAKLRDKGLADLPPLVKSAEGYVKEQFKETDQYAKPKFDYHLACFPGFIKPNLFFSSLNQIAQGSDVSRYPNLYEIEASNANDLAGYKRSNKFTRGDKNQMKIEYFHMFLKEDLDSNLPKEHSHNSDKSDLLQANKKNNNSSIDCNSRKTAYYGIVAQRDKFTKDFQVPQKSLKKRSSLEIALLGPENPLSDRQSHFFGQRRLSTIDVNNFQRDYLRQLGKETLISSNCKGHCEATLPFIERAKILSFSKSIHSSFLKKRKYTYLLEETDQWHLLFQEQLRTALEDTRKYPTLTPEQGKNTGQSRIKVSAPLMMARFYQKQHSYKVLDKIKKHNGNNGPKLTQRPGIALAKGTLSKDVTGEILNDSPASYERQCNKAQIPLGAGYLVQDAGIGFLSTSLSRTERTPLANFNFVVIDNKVENLTPGHYSRSVKPLEQLNFFTEKHNSELNYVPWVNKNSLPLFNNLHWLTQEPLNPNSWSIIGQWSLLVALLFWVEQMLLHDIFPALFALEQLLLGSTSMKSGDRTHVIRVSKSNTPKFKDIAGVDGLLGELAELVLFLRGHKERLWSKKSSYGVLLTGPPGTGKTFLVRALANEAEVPVLILSAATLAANKTNGNKPSWSIRHAFRRAKQLAPCILFIDEIDALGKSRGKVITDINEIVADTNLNQIPVGNKQSLNTSGSELFGIGYGSLVAGNKSLSPQMSFLESSILQSTRSEKQIQIHIAGQCYHDNFQGLEGANNIQTGQHYKTPKENSDRKFGPLTQLLVSMDGVSSLSGILILGATNRPELLDPALTRPGRFERIMRVEKPAEQKRIEILQLYSRNLGIQHQIPWSYLANRTIGLTAADLAVAMNYSSLKAILEGSIHTIETVEYGLDCISREKNKNCSNRSSARNNREQLAKSTVSSLLQNKAMHLRSLQCYTVPVPHSLSKNNPSLKHVKIATEFVLKSPAIFNKNNHNNKKRFSSKNKHVSCFATPTVTKKRRDFLCNIAKQCSLAKRRSVCWCSEKKTTVTQSSKVFVEPRDLAKRIEEDLVIIKASEKASLESKKPTIHKTHSSMRDLKKWLKRLAQIAYYQAGKIVVQTLLPLHPPVALINLNLSGITTATTADTYIPIDGTFTCSFLESRLIGLYSGKATELLLNGQMPKRGVYSDRASQPKLMHLLDYPEGTVTHVNSKSNRAEIPGEGLMTLLSVKPNYSAFYEYQTETQYSQLITFFESFGLTEESSKPARSKDLAKLEENLKEDKLLFIQKANQVSKEVTKVKQRTEQCDAKTVQGSVCNDADISIENPVPFRKLIINKVDGRSNTFQSNIGIQEIQTATRLAATMVNNWAFYSLFLESEIMGFLFQKSSPKTTCSLIEKYSTPLLKNKSSRDMTLVTCCETEELGFTESNVKKKCAISQATVIDNRKLSQKKANSELYSRTLYPKGLAKLLVTGLACSFLLPDLKYSLSLQVKNIVNVTGFFSPSHSQKETLLCTGSKEGDKKECETKGFQEGSKAGKKGDKMGVASNMMRLQNNPQLVMKYDFFDIAMQCYKRFVISTKPFSKIAWDKGYRVHVVQRFLPYSRNISILHIPKLMTSPLHGSINSHMSSSPVRSKVMHRRISLEETGINSSFHGSPMSSSQTDAFKLVNLLQFSILQRDRFYPGWFRLYLPDIEATEFIKTLANYYYSLGLQTLTRSSLNEFTPLFLNACHIQLTGISQSTNHQISESFTYSEKDSEIEKTQSPSVVTLEKSPKLTLENKKETPTLKEIQKVKHSTLSATSPSDVPNSDVPTSDVPNSDIPNNYVPNSDVGKSNTFKEVMNVKQRSENAYLEANFSECQTSGFSNTQPAVTKKDKLLKLLFVQKAKNNVFTYGDKKRREQRLENRFNIGNRNKIAGFSTLMPTLFYSSGGNNLSIGVGLLQSAAKRRTQLTLKTLSPTIRLLCESEIQPKKKAGEILASTKQISRGICYPKASKILWGFSKPWNINRLINIGFRDQAIQHKKVQLHLLEKHSTLCYSNIHVLLDRISTKIAQRYERSNKFTRGDKNLTVFVKSKNIFGLRRISKRNVVTSGDQNALLFFKKDFQEREDLHRRKWGPLSKISAGNFKAKLGRFAIIGDHSSTLMNNSSGIEVNQSAQLDASLLFSLEKQIFPMGYKNISIVEREFICNALINSCFSKACLLIDQNRQLIDYFADYLVRFQILRQDQILYIFSTVLLSYEKQI